MYLPHVLHHEESPKVGRDAVIGAAVNYFHTLCSGVVVILLHHALDPHRLACDMPARLEANPQEVRRIDGSA
jgi:hypothetical protein